MAGIIDFFFKTFVPLCDGPERDVDISTLTEFSKTCSPVVLEYADKSKSVKYVCKDFKWNYKLNENIII